MKQRGAYATLQSGKPVDRRTVTTQRGPLEPAPKNEARTEEARNYVKYVKERGWLESRSRANNLKGIPLVDNHGRNGAK